LTITNLHSKFFLSDKRAALKFYISDFIIRSSMFFPG
jgi:hypothetical protein